MAYVERDRRLEKGQSPASDVQKAFAAIVGVVFGLVLTALFAVLVLHL
jgi:hypothetical protein